MSHPRHAWVEVDLAAVATNVRTLAALTPDGCGFMAVVKADGYGHGAVEVAEAALGAGADRLGVATVDEAVRLREAGIDAPLLLLAEAPYDAASTLVEHRVAATVTTEGFASALDAAALAARRTAHIHLKVDTGMNRIGVPSAAAVDLAASLARREGLALEGVFTHFATADEPGSAGFERQAVRFAEVVRALAGARVRPPVVHAANSAATILHPDAHYDMVRCGIAVYGLHPSAATIGAVSLTPAMSVKARISYLKRIAPGEGVSYGLTWVAERPTTIATLPLGYADGVHRVLSGRMQVLIGGRRCLQVGRVCMDQFMVAVPDDVPVAHGDEAVLVGVQGAERIELDELAGLAGTINYELACGFALRLERRRPTA